MSNFVSIMGWAFLPNLVTGWVQTIYYGLTIRAGDPKPAPGSAKYNSHRRVIHMLVVTLYLAYTIYEADHDLRSASNFYADLGVSPIASDRDIKSRFRRLAALHHPDKTGSSESSTKQTDLFMHLKTASETLLDPARRFAYERFGPDVNRWQRCKTIRDYVFRGTVQGILPHYAVAVASMYILGLFGYMDFGKFYRWLILVALATFEAHAVTRPGFPTCLKILNSIMIRVSSHQAYLPFQIIILARKVAITVYIALSQIGPLLAVHLHGGQKLDQTENDEKALQQGLERLENTAKQLDMDAVRLMDMETAPFRGDKEAAANLKGKMREWLVQNTIRADPMVRDALGTSFRKRRIDAPAGAKGNR